MGTDVAWRQMSGTRFEKYGCIFLNSNIPYLGGIFGFWPRKKWER